MLWSPSMITHTQLKKIAEHRFEDGVILYNQERNGGSIYLLGYAVEMGLKAIVCKNLGLHGVPNTMDEFTSVKNTLNDMITHNLDNLLKLCAGTVQRDVKSTLFSEWSTVQGWKPEMRYEPVNKYLRREAGHMQSATRKLLDYFWTQI